MGGLGAVTAAAGVAAWITDALVPGLALGVFGAVLITLALVQHMLLRRDHSHWPVQAVLREDGVELFLRNGEVRGLSWADSDLALNLISRKAPPPANREYLLVWMSDPKIPSIELSAEGYDRLRQAAEAQRLIVMANRRGRSETGTEWIEIRHGATSLQGAPVSPTGTPSRED